MSNNTNKPCARQALGLKCAEHDGNGHASPEWTLALDSKGVPMLMHNRTRMAFDVTTAPRDVLIAFCVWNDPNGCFTDEQMQLEFDRVATRDDLIATITEWSKDI